MTKKDLERARDNVIGWLSLVGWILIVSCLAHYVVNYA